MPWCEDKAITYLNKFGYNVIKLPRAGIEPLDVLGRDRVVQPLGTAAQFWGDDPSLPQPTGPQPTAFASGVARAAVCGGGPAYCPIASLGHPNTKGAMAYAEAIQAALATLA